MPATQEEVKKILDILALYVPDTADRVNLTTTLCERVITDNESLRKTLESLKWQSEQDMIHQRGKEDRSD